jgi:uncharacterized alpha-E superfamily protein
MDSMENEDIIEAEVEEKYLVEAQQREEDIQEALDAQRQKRKAELAAWAEKRKIIVNAPPTTKQLNSIYKKLKKGVPLLKAIRKVCSYPTWQKWKEEYEEVAAIEEQANKEYVELMLEEKLALSQKKGTHMGEIARDKIQMDELQNRIDRIDRLTEIRNKKNSAFGGGVMPVQINFAFGKPK